jgi:hypothetical protein
MQTDILLAHEVPTADAQIEESTVADSTTSSTANTSSYFGPTQKALAASVLVTVLIVVIFALIARKRNKSSGQTGQLKNPTSARVLVGLGLFFFGLGAFYSLASHGLHEALPFLAALPHSTHIYIGAGGAVLGLVFLLLGDRVKKRHHA